MNLNPAVTHDDLRNLFTTVNPPGISSHTARFHTNTLWVAAFSSQSYGSDLNTTFLQSAWVSGILKASCRGGKWRTRATLSS